VHSSGVESESCYRRDGSIHTWCWVLFLVGMVALMSVYAGVCWVLRKVVHSFLVFLVLCVCVRCGGWEGSRRGPPLALVDV